MADIKSPPKSAEGLEKSQSIRAEIKNPTVNPKAFPRFNSVLRPTKKPSANASISIPPSKPFSSKLISQEVAVTLSVPKSFSTLKPKGKFSDAANSADEKEIDAESAKFRSGPPKIAFSSQIPHSKPRFKQVVQPDRRRNEVIFSSKSEIEDLMDPSYSGDEEENTDLEPETRIFQVEGLVPTLLPHQETGVKFMATRENARRHTKGGLLCDDMGLGKTIQSIALMLYRPPKPDSKVKSTLVVMPLALLDQWRTEINTMAPKLSVLVHHGTSSTKHVAKLMSYDVVVTNYDMVKSEHKLGGPIMQADWYRIIADEAHEFRNPSTALAKAMCALKSEGRRWALTGTPIHNKIGDLFTLFKFLGVSTMEYGAKDLTKKLLKAIMLRRTQRVLAKLLPPLQRTRLQVSLTMQEMTVYEHYQGRLKNGLDFRNITKLRQSTDGLVDALPKFIDNVDSVESLAESSVAKFPKDCGPATGEVDEEDLLSNLFGKLSIDTSPSSETSKETFLFEQNSKVQAVRKLLNEERSRRTVVFSSFVVMLRVLVPMLEHEGIGYKLYFGGLTTSQRQETLADFKDPKSRTMVLLCSLKTAAVGLNLISASRVIMVEPWWNPQIVDQAVKRVHRLGQSNEVKCVELYVPDTVEDRMLTLQDKKRELAKHFMEDRDKLTKAEYRFLWTGEIEDEEKAKKDNIESRKAESIAEKVETLKLSEKPKKYENTKVNELPKIKKHVTSQP